MIIEATDQAKTFVSQWLTKLPMIFRLLVKIEATLGKNAT